MKKLSNLLTLVVFLSLFLLLMGQQAYAYLDPGTGSYIFQMLLGLMVGAVFAAKIYWQKLISFFSGIFSKKSDDDIDNG